MWPMSPALTKPSGWFLSSNRGAIGLMIRPPKRFKGSLKIWLADLAAERAAGEIDAVIRTRSQKVIDIWNARAEPLYWPTFKTALRAGCRWLTFLCPGCQQVGEVDLAEFDYHPNAPITALIPELSCSQCCPNPPHARLLRLTRRPMSSEIVRTKTRPPKRQR